MANVLKEGKRGGDLPRIAGGHAVATQQYDYRKSDDGKMPPLMYCVEVRQRSPDHPLAMEGYKVQLTEDEMIAITAEWFTMMNRRRIDAEQKRKRDEAMARGEHHMRDSPLRSRA